MIEYEADFVNLNSLRKIVVSWREAGLLDPETEARILDFEADRHAGRAGRLGQVLALGLGGLLLTAGVLLFVAAHWDEQGPGMRFALVLTLVLSAHGFAVLRRESKALSMVLHAVGTGFCGAGIFLAGQIFHLQAHWPAAFMLWAAGAAAGWWLLRQWPQGLWLAILTPIWLGGEYVERFEAVSGSNPPLWGGLMVVALSYLTLERVSDPILSRGLLWIGWVSAIPLVGLAGTSSDWRGSGSQAPGSPLLWWSLCLLLPLLVDTLIRRRFEWRLSLFAVAVWLLAMADGTPGSSLLSEFWHQFGGFLMAGAMALFLTWWGVQAKRTERINLGILGFGVVVLSYYFSNVMDKFGRSLSLLGLGALFFVLAFVLGKARRRLLNEIRPQSSGGEA